MIQLQLNKQALLFLILALVTFGSGLLMLKSGYFNNDNLMVSAITIDLTITTSFFMFLFLKKQKVNPLSIGLVFVLLILTARIIIPNDQQFSLQIIIDYFAPLVELTIIGLLTFRILKARRHFLSLKSGDFQRKLEQVLFEIFNNKLAAKLASSELSMFYYIIIKWKKNPGFSYHKNSGIIAVIVTILMVAIAEISIVHIVLMKYSPIAAWILFWISLYSIVQIIALGKAIYLRTIYYSNGLLYLHYGWLMSADIQHDNIESVQSIDVKDVDQSVEFIFMGLFKEMEEKGLLLQTKNPIKVSKMFKQAETRAIFIPLDSPDQLIEELSQNSDTWSL